MLNILTTFLNYFGTRKALSSDSGLRFPHICNTKHGNPHFLARSRSARIHAANGSSRLRKHRSIANAAGTSIAHEEIQGGAKSRRARMRHQVGKKKLRRNNTAFVPESPTLPQPPGAYIVEPSFVEPSYRRVDHPYLPPQKPFVDALTEALLRAAEEQKARDDAEYLRQLEQDSEKARAEHDRAMNAEFLRLLKEDERKAEAARRKAENEEFARLLQEDARKYEESHRRAMEEEEQRQEAIEEERREQERREQERCERESNLITVLRVYEAKWTALRSNNVVGEGQVGFNEIPWPSLEEIWCIEDITEERVLEFMRHPLHEHIHGQAKSVRFEMLRWHPDKFESQILAKVMEGHREAVKEAVGRVVRILTDHI